MFDEERFDEMLEEAFAAGYESAIEEIYNESAFDLEAEMDAFDEAQKPAGKEVALNYIQHLPNSAYRKAIVRNAALVNSDKDYPEAALRIRKKILKDYHGNIPKHVYTKAKEMADRIYKANERGKIKDHSAMLKY